MQEKKPHIVFIVSWYKTPQSPVSGTFFEEQARMFQKRGHKVGILYPRHEIRFLGNTRKNNERTPQSIVDKGIPTYYSFTQSFIPKKDYPTKIDLFFINNSAYSTYKAYVKQYGKPDLIHAQSTIYAGIVARFISRKEKIPYFLTKHFTGWILLEKMQRFKAYHNILKEVINDSNRTFIVSHFYKEELLKYFTFNPKKIDVVPNIINSLFCENKQEITLDGKVNLIVIGYLVERKNHLTLFKSIKILVESGKDIILHVVGNGRFENNLKEFVIQNKLEKNIVFHGLLERNQVLQLIKESHILVSSSEFETFGVNIIEALAVGRPVAVLDSGGPRDIVTEKDGILIEENTPEAFHEAIKFMINNYESFDQKEIAESCHKRFGEERVYNTLISFYKNSQGL
jgi:glycosyltransferase involved in cell wall biosynthesis